MGTNLHECLAECSCLTQRRKGRGGLLAHGKHKMTRNFVFDKRTEEQVSITQKGAENFATLCDFAWGNYTPQGIRVNSCPLVAKKTYAQIREDTRRLFCVFLCVLCAKIRVDTSRYVEPWVNMLSLKNKHHILGVLLDIKLYLCKECIKSLTYK